jgi:plastocyanin
MQHRAAALAVLAAILSLLGGLVIGPRTGRAQSTGTGTVIGHVDVAGASVGTQVIVWVEGVEGLDPSPTAELRQAGADLAVVSRGGSVDFPNDDHVFHNVFSLSRTKRFDLGLYRSGETRSVTFERTGVVDVYCNIHPDMAAQVFVLETPLFAITTAGGGFVIPNVPAGTWDVLAQDRYGEAVRLSATVTSGASTTVDFALTGGEVPRSHRRKDGTPYGRYR